MLRLFVHIENDYLKVRRPHPGESFKNPVIWNNEVEFEYTSDSQFLMAWTSLLPDLPSSEAQSLVRLVGARYPVSPLYQQLKSQSPDFAFSDADGEWVFYGGTFNPWHQGHQACLNLLPSDKVCFVLPDRSPFKAIITNDPTVTILELSSRIKFGKRQYLVPTFLLDQIKNPTVEWIERLRREHPEKKLSLLVGFDSFLALPTWTRSEDLLRAVSVIYVVSRMENEQLREKVKAGLLKISPDLQVVFLGRHEHEGLSSTKLRSRG